MPSGKPDVTVRRVVAFEDELVEVTWQLLDGGTFHQRLAIPPKATREARISDEQRDR